MHATKAALALGERGGDGRPTRRYLPGAGSLAIDAGTEDGCLAMRVDQRGYACRSGSACDAGAVEYEAIAP
ncbi:MAG: choice-of-anchor Q domain-containing protein [Dokdonella sp.]|uniref:choice-of-anchor Q domain-containing protein n=1 Tax=Dokdonella sp. TaxID=2291710 RepID=UPI003F7D1505